MIQSQLIVFDAGGSKTTVNWRQAGEVKQLVLPACNPNKSIEKFIKAMHELSLPREARVLFYGSGLSSTKNQEIIHSVFAEKLNHLPEVYTDALGAAHALLGKKPGVFGIMGTGAVFGYFDGKEVLVLKGGYGYLIDDLGGGFEMGKWFLSHFLSAGDTFPEEMKTRIHQLIGGSRTEIISTIYQNQQLELINEIPKIIHEFRNDSLVHKSLFDYFNFSLRRHLIPIYLNTENSIERSVGLVGSVAHFFQDVLKEVLEFNEIKLNILVKSPGENLLIFHEKSGYR